MTALVTADWHLNDLARDRYRHEWQKELRSMINKYNADPLLILGDVTDEKNYHDAWLVNEVVHHLYELSQLCQVVVLRGNHDYTDPDSPFFAFISRMKNVSWINSPTRIGHWLFLPHTNHYKKDWANIPMEKQGWIFAHNTFAGAVGESGHILDGIQLDYFPRGTQIISGDIHAPQTVGKILIYVGAPYTIDFGNSYTPRVLLIDNKELKSVPCTGVQKRLIEIKSTSDLKRVELNKGDLLKVRIHVKGDEYTKWHSTRAYVEEWSVKNGYELVSVQAIADKEALKKSRRNPHQRKSDGEIFLSYGKQRALDKKTLSTGKLIMEQV